MSLKVYKKDAASRQYENGFFRVFQANLKKLFDKKGLDGVLIGFPTVLSDPNLLPDCVLITENRLLIVDFKNFKDQEIYLPSPDRFELDEWRTSSGKIVHGGSCPNPFAQLKRQRSRLDSLLGRDFNEEVGGIGCLVVFHGDIVLRGEIPGRYEAWFDVADLYNFSDAISDMVEVRAKNKNNPEMLRQKYFEAEIYEENIPIDLSEYESVQKSNVELEKVRRERDDAQAALERQINENQELRAQGKSVEEGIRLIKEKEAVLERKESELKDAQEDFGEKQRNYEIAMAEVEKEVEKTRQESEKTRQAELEFNAAREKRRQEEAKARRADVEYEATLVSEYRKKKTSTIFAVIIVAAIVVVIVALVIHFLRSDKEAREQAEQAEQALVEDKKSGKTCVGLGELAEYAGIKNVCVEYIVGNIADNDTWIYLNRVTNTDFAAIIRKEKNILTVVQAKDKYLNRRVRVRGTIKYYDSARYKYYEIIVDDLSQIEILQ